MIKELEKTMPQESIEKAKYKFGVLKEIKQIDALEDEEKKKIEALKKETREKQKPILEKIYNDNLVADLCDMFGWTLPRLLRKLDKLGIEQKGKGGGFTKGKK
jgi:hypothetical protein